MTKPYCVVGHRGDPEHYPENSLPGLRAAAEAGADGIELDIQVSRDGVPIVFHDTTLDRTTEMSGELADFTAQQLKTLSCHEPRRFRTQHKPTPIATLADVCEALKHYRGEVFVEIKTQAFVHRARADVLDAVLEAISPIRSQTMIISFDIEVLQLAENYCPIGWVMTTGKAGEIAQARELKPQVLICDVKKMSPDAPLPEGPWSWFLYDIVDPQLAQQWADKGVKYIESWDPVRLLKARG